MGSQTFSSRKQPDGLSWRMYRCERCDTVYASPVFPVDVLRSAYESADFDTVHEAGSAAATYANALFPLLKQRDCSHSGGALEIGAGTGAFLPYLVDAGYAPVTGVEPSIAAVNHAEDDVRKWIRHGFFDVADYQSATFDLICCFQTLEHVDNPAQLSREIFTLLRPGGVAAFVTHDYRAPINRLLGRRSPIVDIEHLQLYSAQSLNFLLRDSDFQDISVARLRNTYPLRYWVRLAPMPDWACRFAQAGLGALGMGSLSVSLNVGNLLTIAQKPLSREDGG